MIQKYLSFALISFLLITANSSPVSAQTRINKDDSAVAKVKAAVLKRGTDVKKRVKVEMLNGTQIKGYISQAGEDSFTVTDSKTNQATSIAYGDVAQIKGGGLSKGGKIGLGIGIGAVAVAAIVLGSFLVIRCRNEGGC